MNLLCQLQKIPAKTLTLRFAKRATWVFELKYRIEYFIKPQQNIYVPSNLRILKILGSFLNNHNIFLPEYLVVPSSDLWNLKILSQVCSKVFAKKNFFYNFIFIIKIKIHYYYHSLSLKFSHFLHSSHCKWELQCLPLNHFLSINHIRIKTYIQKHMSSKTFILNQIIQIIFKNLKKNRN